jgi:isopentenyl-diphosphate Delta-isomerase
MLRAATATAAAAAAARRAMADLAGVDPAQAALMAERVVLVDRADNPLGAVTKHAAHLVATGLPLHRAFSVFLFDTDWRMLIQQRAAEKVTYPGYWANACCSHPLWGPRELGDPSEEQVAAVKAEIAVVERAEAEAEAEGAGARFRPRPPRPEMPVRDPVLGVKRAAIRKLRQELGVADGVIAEADLHFVTRFHYRAVCDGGVWGEHEMDYVLVAVVKPGFEVLPAANEVQAVKWCGDLELQKLFREESRGVEEGAAMEPRRFSPWFRGIMDSQGWTWWQQLQANGISSLELVVERNTIRTLGECAGTCETAFHPTVEHPEEGHLQDVLQL